MPGSIRSTAAAAAARRAASLGSVTPRIVFRGVTESVPRNEKAD